MSELPRFVYALALSQILVLVCARRAGRPLVELLGPQGQLWAPLLLGLMIRFMHARQFASWGRELPVWARAWVSCNDILWSHPFVVAPALALGLAAPRLWRRTPDIPRVLPWVELAMGLGWTAYTLLSVTATVLGIFIGGGLSG